MGSDAAFFIVVALIPTCLRRDFLFTIHRAPKPPAAQKAHRACHDRLQRIKSLGPTRARLFDLGGACRRRAAEAGRLDHRSDLLRLDLHVCRHAERDRLHRAGSAARRIRPLRQPQRKSRRAQTGRAGERRIGAAVFQRHGGHGRAADGQVERRRRSRLLQRVLPSQPRVLHQAPVAVRRHDASGAGLRLRGHGSRHHAPHAAAGQRVADQSALERRRHRAVCGPGPTARRRNADRRHAGHSLQRAAARRRRRLRPALGHQVSGRAQRSAGRRDHRLGRKTGCGPQAARHHGRHQFAAKHLSARSAG